MQKLIEIGLNAAIVAVVDFQPKIFCIPGSSKADTLSLPFGPFDPLLHRTMEIGLRGWVKEQSKLDLGYIEQLYTFGDRGRHRSADDDEPHVVSVGYLALTRLDRVDPPDTIGTWCDWYGFLPWEDWRKGRPQLLDDVIIPKLLEWSEIEQGSKAKRTFGSRDLSPLARIRVAFGLADADWDDELVLDRYELMYSAGLLEEAVVDRRVSQTGLTTPLGAHMSHDHRRILATAISRLRSKLKYRPVVFEVVDAEFTLLELQQVVECIFGRAIHKQNFRRLVEKTHLVEPTGASKSATGGRPAALFRFRREVIEERPAPGLRIGRC